MEEDSTFNLLPNSQCINGGNPNFQKMFSNITLDLANNQRVVDNIVDIGAYEYYLTTSIDVYSNNAAAINIYPNPTDGLIHINHNNIIGKVILYNGYGKSLLEKEFRDEIVLDISNYSCGIYFILLIDSDNKRITKKIIKK